MRFARLKWFSPNETADGAAADVVLDPPMTIQEQYTILNERFGDVIERAVHHRDLGDLDGLVRVVDRGLRLDELGEVIRPSVKRPRRASALRSPQIDPARAALPSGTAELPVPQPPPTADDAGQQGHDVPLYLISTRFLATACDFCLSGGTAASAPGGEEPEWVALVTGIRFGPVRIWDQLLTTPIAYQSPVAAVIDQSALSAAMRQLDHYSHALYGVVHSHRHGGAPKPSQTDVDLQHILEAGGYPAIQAVFSASGHVRFFADHTKFEVLIYGTGIERLDYRLFRLVPPPPPPPTRTAALP